MRTIRRSEGDSRADPGPLSDDAEDDLLSALLFAGGLGTEPSRAALRAVQATGLTAEHFGREKARLAFAAIESLVESGQPAQITLVAAKLEAQHQLRHVGGVGWLREVTGLGASVSAAAHVAALVIDNAHRREQHHVGGELQHAAATGGLTADPELAARIERLLQHGRGPTGRFPGLPHAEAMQRPLQRQRFLVDGLVGVGDLGAVVGLPESWKSWLALHVAFSIATGTPVLERFEVPAAAPVGYWFQDDGSDAMLERLQHYAHVHQVRDSVPIQWHLAEGLTLPDGLADLRREIERYGQRFVVLDSLYNFAPSSMKLKDEEVGSLLAQLKREVCDTTGCTICVVDHAGWPTENNRNQRRAYGSVFKSAAFRWLIHLERQPNKDEAWIEAHGNNIGGLPRTTVAWNPNKLQLAFTAPTDASDALDERVHAYLTQNPGSPTQQVEQGVAGGRQAIRASLKRLATHKRVAARPGPHPSGKYWHPVTPDEIHSPGDMPATPGETLSLLSQGQVVAESPAPFRGRVSEGDTQDSQQ